MVKNIFQSTKPSGRKRKGGGEYPELTPLERSRIYYKKWADKKPDSLKLISRRRNKEQKEKRIKVIWKWTYVHNN